MITVLLEQSHQLRSLESTERRLSATENLVERSGFSSLPCLQLLTQLRDATEDNRHRLVSVVTAAQGLVKEMKLTTEQASCGLR